MQNSTPEKGRRKWLIDGAQTDSEGVYGSVQTHQRKAGKLPHTYSAQAAELVALTEAYKIAAHLRHGQCHASTGGIWYR